MAIAVILDLSVTFTLGDMKHPKVRVECADDRENKPGAKRNRA